MGADSAAASRPDDIERAHLREPGDVSHRVSRYEPGLDLRGLVRRFWIPVWSLPPGLEAPQRACSTG